MKLKIIYKLLIISVLTLISFNANSQIYGIGADYIDSISYSTNKTTAIYLVFNANENNWNATGGFKVLPPVGSKGWSFKCLYFNPDSSRYDTIQIQDNVDSFVCNSLKQGFYKVRMTKDSVDTIFDNTLYAWVIINKLRFHLAKTADGYVTDTDNDCFFLDIRAVQTTEQRFDQSLRYYHDDFFKLTNPETNEIKIKTNEITFTVKAPDTIYTSKKYLVHIYDPPAENTKYLATLTDKYGNTATDEVTYLTITTKADFEMYVAEDTVGTNFTKYYKKEIEGEAKMWGRFINTSKNGVKFKWQLADSIFHGMDSTLFLRTTTDSTDTITDLLYNNPYIYKIKLISYSDRNCKDTAKKELTVLDSKIGNQGKNAFPKFFTPDGDDVNDYFGEKLSESDSLQSIRNLKLYIYNSRGNLIWECNEKLADGWTGWDGKTRWGMDAPPGIYYYYFEAEGYGPIESSTKSGEERRKDKEKDPPRKQPNQGYFYLFRGN